MAVLDHVQISTQAICCFVHLVVASHRTHTYMLITFYSTDILCRLTGEMWANMCSKCAPMLV